MHGNAECLPLLVAGPIVRRCTLNVMAFWIVTSQPIDSTLHTSLTDGRALKAVNSGEYTQRSFQVGERAYIHWITWLPEQSLPSAIPIYYNFYLTPTDAMPEEGMWVTELSPSLLYDAEVALSVVIDLAVKEVIHGSCRKPHHDSDDALVQVDRKLSHCIATQQPRPNYLMMSGDQVYIDDVAGPMLHAIHQVVQRMGLYNEILPETELDSAADLLTHPSSFYLRSQLLPSVDSSHHHTQPWYCWQGKSTPIFTSDSCDGHLISLSEMIAMYLLVWSPALWESIQLEKDDVAAEFQERYQKETVAISGFVDGLSAVQRMLAHIPCYMIFDDHDITDDWNLHRGWEEACYGHPFSKRIVGNALCAYLLCQGWGNDPHVLSSLHTALDACFSEPDNHTIDPERRSESRRNKPSGLMDWESLCHLQQQLLKKEAVILVSAAPIYGVKLIEAVQKIVTFLGQPLMVDAENWMAHRGTASVMLNIFRHKHTPPLFIILSGDVHYSFVYDVRLRFSHSSPHICQITASGIKNEFPHRLLSVFDRLNRYLFHRRSPLNWLTQRRYMSIRARQPSVLRHANEHRDDEMNQQHIADTSGNTLRHPHINGAVLCNASGVGVLRMNADHSDIQTSVLTANGDEVHFS